MTEQNIEDLKKLADELGVSYAPNISYNVLEKRVTEAQQNKPEIVEKPKVKTSHEARRESEALIRCIVSCKNPNRTSWEGDIFSVGNPKIGFIKRYVHFNEPWHVPKIIFDMLKKKKYQRVYTKKEGKKEVVKTVNASEYDIEILPPLTKKELKDLAQRQLAKGIIDED